jgi:hypothetical protein
MCFRLKIEIALKQKVDAKKYISLKVYKNIYTGRTGYSHI